MEIKVVKHDRDGLKGLSISVFGPKTWGEAEEMIRQQIAILGAYDVVPTTGKYNTPQVAQEPKENVAQKSPEQNGATEAKMVGDHAECLKFIHMVAEKKGEQVARNILDAFGVSGVTKLKGNDHPMFIKKCSEALR